jgi:hypothetical protein
MFSAPFSLEIAESVVPPVIVHMMDNLIRPRQIAGVLPPHKMVLIAVSPAISLPRIA